MHHLIYTLDGDRTGTDDTIILDFGSITILWSQPVTALQIMSPDGKWRWVKHIPNALVSHLSRKANNTDKAVMNFP